MRHKVKASTRRRVMELRKSHSLSEVAAMTGDAKLKATISAIERGVDSVGAEAEKRLRRGLGMPDREERPAERERRELLVRLNRVGVSLTEALRIAAEAKGV